jgi:hypothetical protein
MLLAAGLAATAGAEPRIVNGLPTHDHPTTGAMLHSGGGAIDDDNATVSCSGTLIGCRTFLTAAHCVEGDTDASHYWVYLQHAGIQTVTSVVPHPSYTPSGFPEFDVAILKLAAPVTGVVPTPINTAASPSFGSAGTIAGFGQTSGGANDYGIKRAGAVVTSDCTGIVSPLGNTELVCWRFTSPVGPPGTDANTCQGDSGGPLFVDLGSGVTVAGVTSGGTGDTCLATDESYDANVFTYRAFIAAELGTDSTVACGAPDPVGDPTTAVIGYDGTFGTANPSDTFTIPVGGTPLELRVALNGEDNGSLDANLYVKQGLGASPSSFDCRADGRSNFGACAFTAPAAGDWSVFVERRSGAGDYQVTATIFGGTPPVCGNGVREAGEDCDGTDDAACPGSCGPDCTCPSTCNPGDLLVQQAAVDEVRFRWKLELANAAGTYDTIDPRNQLRFVVTQGVNAVTVDIPALDAGWATSVPERGRFKWKGLLDGVKLVKLTDQTATRGVWKALVAGRLVPGAGGIDLADPTPIDVQLTADGACAQGNW